MSYSGIAASIKSKVSAINSIVSNIESIPFDSTWNSLAYLSMSAAMDENLKNLKLVLNNLNTYSNGALIPMDDYILIVEKIEKLQLSLDKIPSDTQENIDKRSELSEQIDKLLKEKEELKKSIVGACSSAGVNISGAGYSLLSFVNSGNFDYVVDINSLVNIYGNSLWITNDLYSLYDVRDANGNIIEGSGREYVNKQLESVQASYSGREAVINTALMALKLASDKGAKLRYRHEGSNMVSIPYNTNEQLAQGMDCCEFVSWAINKGSSQPFHWQGVEGLANIGQQIEYSAAQPGDIFIINNSADGGQGHVGLIVSNNPETGEFVIAEAKGTGYGIITRTVSYETLMSNGFHVRDYSSVYGDQTQTVAV